MFKSSRYILTAIAIVGALLLTTQVTFTHYKVKVNTFHGLDVTVTENQNTETRNSGSENTYQDSKDNVYREDRMKIVFHKSLKLSEAYENGEHDIDEDDVEKKTYVNEIKVSNIEKPNEDQTSVHANHAGKNNIARDSAGKNNIARDSADKNNIARDSAGKNNIARDSADKNNIARDSAGKNNIARDSADKNNVAWDSADKNNVARDSTDKNNIARDSAGKKTISITNPSCKELISGSRLERMKAILFDETFPYVKTTNYTVETKNCDRFKRKFDYILHSTEEEKDFPLAFSIVMYKDVDQLERLLRAIYRPQNFYCIQVDEKAKPNVRDEVRSIVSCFPNVFLCSKQVKVVWGKFSVLETELNCMKDLLGRPGWKYFINLTGQEFPLKTNLELVKILKILNGTNSVDANDQKRWKTRRWQKAPPPPHNITPYKGNLHAVVSRDFVEYAIHDPRAQAFTSWLKKTVVPDESFFSTLDNNPHLKVPGSSIGRVSTDYDLKPYIARFKNWGPQWRERSFDWPCAGKRVRQICIFGVGDLPLLTSRRELFANKFHIDFEPQALNCLEEWHRNRTIEENKGHFKMNYDFYKSLPQLITSNNV